MVCGVNAFNLTDLTRPESTRFRTVLSGIMNFAKFRYAIDQAPERRGGNKADKDIGKVALSIGIHCCIKSTTRPTSKSVSSSVISYADLTEIRTARLQKEVSKIEADIEDIKYVFCPVPMHPPLSISTDYFPGLRMQRISPRQRMPRE